MRRLQIAVFAAIAFAIACDISDSIVGPKTSDKLISKTVGGVPPTNNTACNVHWASGVNGSWFDPTKWNPAGVPTGSSSVCIDAAGTYTVILNAPVDSIPTPMLALSIGGVGATPSLTISGDKERVNISEGVVIASGATLLFDSGQGNTLTAAGTITNAGLLKVAAPCGGCGGATISADIINTGTLQIAGGPKLTLSKLNGAYQNTGNMLFGGFIEIPATAGAATFSQEGGLWSGAANSENLTMKSGVFTLKGGKIRSRQNLVPVLILDGASLVIDSTLADSVTAGVRGRTDMLPTVTGNVPALTTLWLAGASNGLKGSVELVGNPTNNGTMRVTRTMDASGGILVTGTGRLTNNGTLNNTDANRDTLFYSIDITNNGTINAIGQSSINLDKPSGSYLNFGLIDLQAGISRLTLRSNSDFRNASPGTITNGAVTIIGGSKFHGVGTLLTSLNVDDGGSVAPGDSIGLLTINQLNIGTGGIFNVELSGNTPVTEYDRAVAVNLAGFSGTMNVIEKNGFQSGLCGQVFDVIHMPSAAAGMFPTINGLNPAPGRMLRAIMVSQIPNPPAKIRLVGFDPDKKVCVGPRTVNLTEGGASIQYAIALRDAPTSTVVVKPVPDAQVSVVDSAVFTTSNWQTPQIMTLSAVDDNVYEGTHTGIVRHLVKSGDANYNAFAADSIVATITDNDTPPPVPTTVTVTIDSASMQAAHTAQASVVVRDQNGNIMAGESITWSSDTPAFASVSSSGVVTGISAGSAVIRATDGSATGTASITITAPPPPPPVVTTITVSIDSASLQIPHTAQATAVVKDQYGAVVNGQTVTWTSDTPTFASVSSSGVVTSLAAGSATIRATIGSVFGTQSITISNAPPVVTTITVSIDSSSLQVPHTAQATAVVKDQYGAVMNGQSVTWSSDTPSFASVANTGVVTAVSAGSATIRATIGSVFGTASVIISSAPPPPPVVTTITVAIDSSSLQAPHTAQATAVVKDQYGAVMNGQTVTWSSNTPSFASVSNGGVVTAIAQGSAVIKATIGSVFGTASVSITSAPSVVTTVSVSIDSASLQVGRTAQATATVRDQYNAVMNGQTVTWSSDTPGFAGVSNTGVVTGVSAGSATIRATVGAVSGTASLTITAIPPAPPVVTTITVAIDSSSLEVGNTGQATATVRDQYGAVMSGQSVTWSSNTPSLATVSNLGIVSGVAQGTAEIKATIGGVFGTASISITPLPTQVPTSMTISISPLTIQVGNTVQAVATIRDQFGAAMTGQTTTWSSSDTLVATVSATGLITARSWPGIALITGKSGALSASEYVYPYPPPPPPPGPAAKILFTYSGDPKVDSTVQVFAYVYDANGNYISGAPVRWKSLSPQIISISSTGLVTGLRAGIGTIQATSGTASGTRDITVRAPSVPTSMVFRPRGPLNILDSAMMEVVVYDQYFQRMQGQSVVWEVETPRLFTSLGERDCPPSYCVMLGGLRSGWGKLRATVGKLSVVTSVFVSNDIGRILEGTVSRSSKYTITWWPGCSWDVWIENTHMTSDWRSSFYPGSGSLTATAKMQATSACNSNPWSLDLSSRVSPNEAGGFDVSDPVYFIKTTFQVTQFTKAGISGVLTYHFNKFGGENGRTFDITENIDLK